MRRTPYIIRRCWQMACLLTLVTVCAAAALAQSTAAQLRLSLVSPKRQYVLGEPVKLQVTLVNTSAAPLELLGLLAPRFGSLILGISDDNKTFKSYSGPGWGVADTYAKPTQLQAGQQIGQEFTVLWNHPIPGARDYLAGDFAFPEAITYWLRVQLSDQVPVGPSNIVQISVGNPTGDDAAIWETMKADPKIAYYMQTPRTDIEPSYKSQLEALRNKYPNSSYAPYLREALEKLAGGNRR
jgi:hypothetical protein